MWKHNVPKNVANPDAECSSKQRSEISNQIEDPIQEYWDTFPPGYRFAPTDQDILFYLSMKIQGRNDDLPPNKINDVQIYDYNPQTLLETYKTSGIKDKVWYFFTIRDKKYANGDRPNRSTCDNEGTWKATGVDKPIFDGDNGKQIGKKKTLVYHLHKGSVKEKTGFVMHEYILESEKKDTTGQKHFIEGALCRIHYKADKPSTTNEDNDNDNQTPNIEKKKKKRKKANDNNNNKPKIENKKKKKKKTPKDTNLKGEGIVEEMTVVPPPIATSSLQTDHQLPPLPQSFDNLSINDYDLEDIMSLDFLDPLPLSSNFPNIDNNYEGLLPYLGGSLDEFPSLDVPESFESSENFYYLQQLQLQAIDHFQPKQVSDNSTCEEKPCGNAELSHNNEGRSGYHSVEPKQN